LFVRWINLVGARAYNPGAARKIDEYRIKDQKSHAKQMRLWTNYDDFAKEPESSRLFIIAYDISCASRSRWASM